MVKIRYPQTKKPELRAFLFLNFITQPLELQELQ